MQKNMREARLTIYFEDPFWVGVFERIEDGRLSAAKVTFGAEPKDCEVWDMVLHRYDTLQFSAAIEVSLRPSAGNPKRRQREAKRQFAAAGVGTRSQQALAAQREDRKAERRRSSKERKKTEIQHRFDLKQQKRKEKHKGH